jgi:hypothetical protein
MTGSGVENFTPTFSGERYGPFFRKVWTFFEEGTDLLKKRYGPFFYKVQTFFKRG